MAGTDAVICSMQYFNSSNDTFTCREGTLGNHVPPTSYYNLNGTLNTTTNNISYSNKIGFFNITYTRFLKLNSTLNGVYTI